VKHDASVNAAPNPKIVCAAFVGSTVTSAAVELFATFVYAISAPAASRFPLLSVISVCAGFVGRCASFASTLALTVTLNTEAAAAPTPSPAYCKTSRRVVTLGSRLSLHHSRGLQPKRFASPDSILQNRYSEAPISAARDSFAECAGLPPPCATQITCSN
jgi:hypothetical protein